MTLDIRAYDDMTYGMYLVGALGPGGKPNAMIANTVFQVTAELGRIAACVNKESLTHEYIKNSGFFCAQPVKEGADMIFVGNFGFHTGRGFDKFAKYKYKLTANNLPAVLDNTLDIIEAKVEQAIDAGTHTIFIGAVIAAEILGDGRPLTYAYYKEVMRGKTPRGATTFKGDK